MNILLTNDDGYNAVGIHALAKQLSKEHEVVIVAPENEQSGASHSVSFFSGITFRKINCEENVESYAVSGTPADCVLFGIKHILKDRKIDIVVSGINNVLNVGSDIMYSGTFGAAQEATYLGYKGIAVSLDAKKSDDYEFSSCFVAKNLEMLSKFASKDATINVNIPFCCKTDIKGVRVAPVAFRPYFESFEMHKAPDESEVYFVNGYPYSQKDSEKIEDVPLIENGYITISPVKMTATVNELIEIMQKDEFIL